MKTIPQILSAELNQPEAYIQNVIALLDEGNTIPFIARYRKEAHGAMDDTTLRTLETRLQYLKNLQSRRDEVKSSIESQGKLTDELSAAIDEAATLAEVEDLYRPYKQKRRTRATVAREKGLEPLAEVIFAQTRDLAAPDALAQNYLDAEKGVETIADALQGANDIIAEWISDDAAIRKSLRELLEKRNSAELEQLMEQRRSYRYHGGESRLRAAESVERYHLGVAAPIVAEGDLMGCVMLLMGEHDAAPTESEQALAQTFAGFLGKQMES